MSSINPAIKSDTIYQGAAHIIIDKTGAASTWKYIFCEGDVTIRLIRTEAEQNIAGYGSVTELLQDEVVELTFTPVHHIDSDILAFLWGSVLSAMPGASYYGATDQPVYIHTMAGRIFTIANCRPTTFVPIIMGAPGKRFGGSVTCTGVLKYNTGRATASALFTTWADQEWTAYPEASTFQGLPCTATWDSLAGTALQPLDGWTLTPIVELTPLYLSNIGTIDYRIQSVALEVSGSPANLSEANLWAEAAIGNARTLGSQRTGGDFTLTEDEGGITATITNALWIDPKTRYNPTAPISDQALWRSRRKAANGSWAPAGTIAMTTPAAPPPLT